MLKPQVSLEEVKYNFRQIFINTSDKNRREVRKKIHYLNDTFLYLMDLFSFKIIIVWTTVRLFPSHFLYCICNTFNVIAVSVKEKKNRRVFF